jgi:hypothetical protein
LNGNRVVGEFTSNRYAKTFLDELSQKRHKGITLIVCAGMNYASHVEARGYNVLTSAEILSERLVPEMMKKLGFEKV